jgi:hypothetical protein
VFREGRKGADLSLFLALSSMQTEQNEMLWLFRKECLLVYVARSEGKEGNLRNWVNY